MATYPQDVDKIAAGAASMPLCGNGGSILCADNASHTYYFDFGIDWSAGEPGYTYSAIVKSLGVFYTSRMAPRRETETGAPFGFATGGLFDYMAVEAHILYNRCGRRISGSGSSAVYSNEPLPYKVAIRDGSHDGPVVKTLTLRPQVRNPGDATDGDAGFRIDFTFSGDIKRIYTF